MLVNKDSNVNEVTIHAKTDEPGSFQEIFNDVPAGHCINLTAGFFSSAIEIDFLE